jgi:hypothetical protein
MFGYVILGVLLFAVCGYAKYLADRLAVVTAQRNDYFSWCLEWEARDAQWEMYTAHLIAKLDSVRIDLAVKTGKAIKVGNDTHIMPMFDNMIGTLEARDIQMDRDNPNRPVFGSGAGKFVSANGKAKDYEPIVRSGIDPDTGLPYARVEYVRKPETMKESKGKSKDSKPEITPASTDSASKESVRAAQVLLEVEKSVKVTPDNLAWLNMKVPFWLEKNPAIDNAEMVKRCLGQFGKAK